MLRKIGYVIVYVRDMESSLEFWRDKVGLRERYTSEEWSELEVENTVLALHHSDNPTPRDTGIVFTVEDIEKTVEELREKGVEVTEPKDIGVGLEALFKDPEGNTYHLFQPAG